MPLLTANYSAALAELIHTRDAPIDAIEVGPWFSPAEIEAFQAELPGWTFQFHTSSLANHPVLRPGGLQRLHGYLSITQTPWVSIHMELLPWYVYLLSSRLGLHLSPPHGEQAARRFLRTVARIRAAVDLPVVLENLASLPQPRYHDAARPKQITAILEAANCQMLLDLAHARIAASYQGLPVREYLARLPLDRVVQVHTSGPRMRSGRLYDAHDALQDEDYDLLTWVLPRCRPQIVTLEYFRQPRPLHDQLQRLRTLLETLPP